jgi:hypothetical protein
LMVFIMLNSGAFGPRSSLLFSQKSLGRLIHPNQCRNAAS